LSVSEAQVSLAVTFGTNLRNQRKAKGLTQAELAEKVDLSTEMVSKMERGAASPSFPTIEKLAKSLGVSEGAFFGSEFAGPDSDRMRVLSKIQVRLSRLNDDQLVRANKMLAALTD
jgi:transcriptional regulator with XRE-family HTH domain